MADKAADKAQPESHESEAVRLERERQEALHAQELELRKAADEAFLAEVAEAPRTWNSASVDKDGKVTVK